MGEHLAFATVLNEGFSGGSPGQDSERGTFLAGHSVYTDQGDEPESTRRSSYISRNRGPASEVITRLAVGGRPGGWSSSTAIR